MSGAWWLVDTEQPLPCVCWIGLATPEPAQTKHCGCQALDGGPPEACHRVCTVHVPDDAPTPPPHVCVWPKPCLTCGRTLASWCLPLHV